jgi:hypothetical protein
MKLTLKIVIAAVLLTVVCFAAQARQQEETISADPKPKWISNKGFWVVKGNVGNPKENTVYFYNNNNVEVYKEVVSGEILKLKKRKTLMTLKKTLETAVIAWEQNKPVNEKLFVAALGNK